MYEKKISEQATLAKTNSKTESTLATSPSKIESGSGPEALIHQRRASVVQGVFGEFEQTKKVSGFQTCLEFLVDIAGNSETGFTPYVVYETKNNPTRKVFAEVFVENYTEEVTEKEAQSMLSFLLVAYYESPGLFETNQLKQLKKTVLRYISTFKNDKTLILSMKAFVMLHSANNYDAESVKPILPNLTQIEQSKNE